MVKGTQSETNSRIDEPRVCLPSPVPITQRHRGISVNVLDISRATEKTAILLSLLSGRMAPHITEASIGHAGLHVALAHLSQAVINPRFLHLDEALHGKTYGHLSREYRLAGDKGTAEFHAMFPSGPDRKTDRFTWHDDQAEFDIDLLMCPIDGKGALRSGIDGGSVAVIGGAPPNCLREPKRMAKAYFVIVVSEDLVNHLDGPLAGTPIPKRGSGLEVLIERLKNEIVGVGPPQLDSFISGSAALADLIRGVQGLSAEPTIGLGTLSSARGIGLDPKEREWQVVFRRSARCRQFEGSSIVGALAASLERFGIHMYVAVARRAHIVAMSIAAHALGGGLLAIPLQDPHSAAGEGCTTSNRPKAGEPSRRHSIYRTQGSDDASVGEILSHKQIAFDPYDPGVAPEAFLTISGITETIVVRGVRFRPDRRVESQSLCLLSRGGSRRTIQHSYDLNRGRFQAFVERDGHTSVEAVSGIEAIERFKRKWIAGEANDRADEHAA